MSSAAKGVTGIDLLNCVSSSSTLADIDGLKVCKNAGTTTEKNITEGAGLVGARIEMVTV